MLSEKEVLDLGERVLDHISLVEKFGVYAQQCPDQQVRDVLARQQQVLQSHYQTLVGFIQNVQNIPGGMTTTTQTQWRTLS
ncbi:MAG: hypothetical protein M1543_00815 [Firmicutes bacterium]|nr:hypothetical protein [Bacillota bacterium]